ncbi:MAG: restriction endonuclease subunit S [Verrucomicrobiota bacterium]
MTSLPTVPVPRSGSHVVRRVEGLFALADPLELRLAKARGQVDQLTPSLLARAWTPSPPARLSCAISLREIRLARSQRARLTGKLVPKKPQR